ncbi:cytidine deaminase [Metallumcola ferriviriculae]|uniref:Cytidine deaminase n=1 Tax=Metallumcola ferriviriculae TaxID=3039180 RepID=A0AAU0UM23_9FIRM|nr:cytidine deaminase [Desulfitibacteraceae bacterium MK1]
MTDQQLITAALLAQKNAYVPYSKFPVGAAVLTKSGKVFTGCNVENASYGSTTCAERTAIAKAVSEGEREFSAIAIVCGSGEYCSPCGSCRQIITEFGEDIRVLMANKDGEYREKLSAELLPGFFKL